jgi:hypothetical protein
MDPTQRAAVIERLRGCIAAGHRNITDIHFPLAELLQEDGRRDDAAYVLLGAATVAWEDGFILKAFACLRRCLEVVPTYQAAHAQRTVWLAVINPDLRPWVDTHTRRGTVCLLRHELEELHRGRITTCAVRYDPSADRLTVSLDHPSGAIPLQWLESSRFFVELIGTPALIPVAVTIIRDDPTVHELALEPTVGDGTFSQLIRVGPTGTFSNVASVQMDTGVGPMHRIRNVYCLCRQPVATFRA